ncbi:MAG: hypothetical protein ACOYMX_02310 [Burkholderiales bacterium]
MTNRDALVEAIGALADASGVITPEVVVEAAKNPDSPLHEHFDWDDQSAAHQHRIDTARKLIRGIRVQVTNNRIDFKVPMFVRDPAAAPSQQGYVSISSLRTDEERARDVIVREFSIAAGALERARAIAAYLEMTDQIEEVRLRVMELDAAVRERGGATAQ